MTFILRWPAILVLFALSLLSLAGALAAAGLITGYEAPIAQVHEAQVSAARTGVQATWLDVALLGGAGIFFLISAIRLIRRTQGFWTWLFGFACYGARWAMAQEDDLAERVKGLDLSVYMHPQALIADTASFETQIGLLGVILIVGILILIVDAVDRAYWENQGA